MSRYRVAAQNKTCVCDIVTSHLRSVAKRIVFFPDFLRPWNKVYVTLLDFPRIDEWSRYL